MHPATHYAPAERLPPDEIAEQALRCAHHRTTAALEGQPVGVVLLNRQRQILYGNCAFRRLAGGKKSRELLGLRPGEALGCIHSNVMEAGCGTSRFCRFCGSAKAVLRSLEGLGAVEECRMLRVGDMSEEALDLQVYTTPFQAEGCELVLFTILDISRERRLRVLEQYAYHEALAEVGTLRNLAETMETELPPEYWDYCHHLRILSERLLEGLRAQRDLAEAEQSRFIPAPEQLDPGLAVETAVSLLREHPCAMGRTIRVERDCALGGTLVTDPVLLSRILVNLLRNALEAVEPGGPVTIACRDLPAGAGGGVEFSVRNPGAMSEAVRRQLFKRSFSTKGEGRGVGLHAARIYATRYLGGSLDFASDEERGTVFTLRLPNLPS
jgi:signal transduction histidine kinase